MKLPDKQRAKMEAKFQGIYALSCQSGVKAIMDEARYWIVSAEDEPCSGLSAQIKRSEEHYNLHPQPPQSATVRVESER